MGLDPGHFVFEKKGFGHGAGLRGCFWEDSRVVGMMSRLFLGGCPDPILLGVLFHPSPNYGFAAQFLEILGIERGESPFRARHGPTGPPEEA